MALTLLEDCPVTYDIMTGEQWGGYNSSDTDQGPTDSIAFRVGWEDRHAFRAFVKGYTAIVDGNTVRLPPLSSPYTPGIFARAISGQAVGKDGTTRNYRPFTDIVYRVDFGYLPYDPSSEGPYMSVRYRKSTSVATIPGATLQFSNGEYIDHDYGILLGQFSIEITQYQVPDLVAAMATLLPLGGLVNSDPVVIKGVTYAAGSLHMPSLDGDETVNVTGNRQQQLSVSLIWRSIPWNSNVRSDGVVDEVVPNPYLLAPFSPAFS